MPSEYSFRYLDYSLTFAPKQFLGEVISSEVVEFSEEKKNGAPLKQHASDASHGGPNSTI